MSSVQGTSGLQPRMCATARRTRQELRQARANVATLALLEGLGMLQGDHDDLVAVEHERLRALQESLAAAV
jgi:hypothetical protein